MRGMWQNQVSDDGRLINVIPLRDEWEHHPGPDCVCGPELETIGTDNDRLLLVRHHSLDGREHPEVPPMPTPEPQTLTVTLAVVDDHVDFQVWHDGPNDTLPMRLGMLTTMSCLLDGHIGSMLEIDTD